MPTNRILNEDWTDYDNRKIRDNRDGRYFACTESWEVDYLKNKIKRLFPYLSDQAILNAITDCCRTIPPPHPRRTFVQCVVQRLGIR